MGSIAKNPKPGHCIVEVTDHTGFHWNQCQNKRKEGDFCGVHSPQAQARRDAKSQVAHEAWKKRINAPSSRIKHLETVNTDLLAALETISGGMCSEACQNEDICEECPASNDAEHDTFVQAVLLARDAIAKAKEASCS